MDCYKKAVYQKRDSEGESQPKEEDSLSKYGQGFERDQKYVHERVVRCVERWRVGERQPKRLIDRTTDSDADRRAQNDKVG